MALATGLAEVLAVGSKGNWMVTSGLAVIRPRAQTGSPNPAASLGECLGDIALTDLYDADPEIRNEKPSRTLSPELPPDREQKQRKQR